MPLTTPQAQFAQDALDAARSVVTPGQEWLAPWMAAVACLESAWGTAVPTDAAGHTSNNYIGYHWVPGQPWSIRSVLAKESGTGQQIRYRVFRDLEDCMYALYYLITKSSLYDQARRDLHARVDDARRTFIADFSNTYCPANPDYAATILSIIKEVLGQEAVSAGGSLAGKNLR